VLLLVVNASGVRAALSQEDVSRLVERTDTDESFREKEPVPVPPGPTAHRAPKRVAS